MVKKAKKRGVKPGTKRGPYRRTKIMTLADYSKQILEPMNAKLMAETNSVGKPINLTLCEQLEETITRLENRVSNSIARINALIGQI